MKSLLLRGITLSLLSLFFVEGVSAYTQTVRIKRKTYGNNYTQNQQQTYYQNPYYDNRPMYNNGLYNGNPNNVVCPNFSSASVGVGNVSNGVNVSIVSNDYQLQQCIKNTSWVSYFTRYGGGVTVSVTQTTLGVQIIATSYDSYTVSELQNARWSSIITGISAVYTQPVYNNNPYYYQNPYYTNPYQPPTYNPYIPPYNYQYTPPPYRLGRDVFGGTTQYMNRSLINTGNGVKMYLTSPDYNTALYLQRFSFTDIFSSRLSGVSISQSSVSGGIEVSVTSGNTSTITEIQNIAYNLIYK